MRNLVLEEQYASGLEEEHGEFFEQFGNFGFATHLKLAPFIVMRTGCLSYKHLHCQYRSEMVQLLEQYQQAKAQQTELEKNASDQIFSMIPEITDAGLRRKALKLRRDIHNGRTANIDKALEHWLIKKAGNSQEHVLGYVGLWLQVRVFIDQVPRELEKLIELSRLSSRQLMLDVSMTNEVFRKGLALSAPNLMNKLKPKWIDLPHSKRKHIERSVFAYMNRATTKTSPFSTLTLSSVLPLKREYQSTSYVIEHYCLHLESYLNRSIPTAIREVVIRQPKLSSVPFDLAINAQADISENNKVKGFFRRYEVRKGTLWAEQFFSSMQVNANLYKALINIGDQCVDLGAVADYFSDLEINSKRELERVIQKLLRRDILRFSGEWGAYCQYPALYLSEQLKISHDDVRTKQVKEGLIQLQHDANELCKQDSQQRPAKLAKIQSLYTEMLELYQDSAFKDVRNPVLEDAWMQGVQFNMGKGVRERLSQVAQVVASKLQVSSEYLWLRDQFVLTYGHGGICKNVEGFIQESWQKFSTHYAVDNTKKDNENGQFGDINTDYLQIPLSLYFQFSAESVSELDDINTPLVLNGVYNRIGWQVARSTNSDSSFSKQNTQMLRQWLKKANAPFKAVGTTISGTSSNLQAHTSLCEKNVVVDGVVASDSDIRLSDLTLKHVTDSNMLHFYLDGVEEVRINYLGSAVPMIAWGPRYLLLALTEPLHIGRPSSNFLFAGESDPDFRHQERVEENNCVLLRETWWLKVSLLASVFELPDDSQKVIKLAEIWHKYKLPQVFYVNGQPADLGDFRLSSVEKHRKPVWVDILHPFCLEQLLRIAHDVDWLVIREALPEPDKNWFEQDKEKYTSEFMIDMVLTGKAIQNG